jgi:hypothetical protein
MKWPQSQQSSAHNHSQKHSIISKPHGLHTHKRKELRTLTQASLQKKRKQKECIQIKIKPLCYSYVSRVTRYHFFVSRSDSKSFGGKYVTYSLQNLPKFPIERCWHKNTGSVARHTVSHALEYPSVMHTNNLQQTYELKDIQYKHTWQWDLTTWKLI